MITRGNKYEVPIDLFLFDSDPDLLPSALGKKYSFIINTLYKKNISLYSYKNSLSYYFNNELIGKLWYINSNEILIKSLISGIFFFFFSPKQFIKSFFRFNNSSLTIKISKNSIYLLSISVNQKYRRNGSGLLLLKELEMICKNNKKLVIELDVDINNQNAINFYKKHGYSELFQHNVNTGNIKKIFLRMQKCVK